MILAGVYQMETQRIFWKFTQNYLNLVILQMYFKVNKICVKFEN